MELGQKSHQNLQTKGIKTMQIRAEKDQVNNSKSQTEFLIEK